MTLDFGWAFTILLLIWVIGGFIGTKTKGKIGSALVSTIILMIGFWTGIIPKDIINTAQLASLYAVVNLVIVVHVATNIDPKQIKRDWRLAITVVIGVIGMGLMVILIGGMIFGRQLAVGVFPTLVGGIIATNTMVSAATAKGLETIAAMIMIFQVTQSLFGLPLISLGSSMEAKRLLKEYRAEHGMSGTPIVPGARAKVVEDTTLTRKPLWDRLPKKYQTPLYPLLLACIFGALSTTIGNLLSPYTAGIVGPTLVALIVGFVAHQAGLMPKAPMNRAGVDAVFMFFIIMYLRNSLATVSFGEFIAALPSILGLFILGALGMIIFGVLVGKLFGYSWGMVLAFGFGVYAGYPLNYSAALEVAQAEAQTEEELDMLNREMVNRVVLGGVVGVTITSVVVASICAALL